MHSQDWMDAEDHAIACDLALVGYFHSHPDSPAVPSAYDVDHALPNFIYIIGSVIAGSLTQLTAHILSDDKTALDPIPLERVP
jgi:proteasome lid subunit RPN8/RPN11